MNGSVYFVGCDGGPIKIGFTVDIAGRLAALQTGSPGLIRLLAECEGNRKTEAFFHSRVRAHRLQGEWFRPDPPVLDLVSMVRERKIEVPAEFLPSDRDVVATEKAEFRSTDIYLSARSWIEELATAAPFGERMEKTLRRVASEAGVSYRAVKAIWYEETDTMKADVYVGLKEAFDAKMSRLLGGVQ